MEIDEPQEPPPQEESGHSPAPEPTEVEQLQLILEEAERERVQFKSFAQRLQADFSNYRRRVEGEQGESQRAANAHLILKFLPVLDDLELALNRDVEKTTSIDPGWLDGVHFIARKFQNVLEEAGVERIEAQEKQFDPWEHEVVSYEETVEHPEGRVLKVVRKGYKLQGRVLRPALVTVAKAP